ncbi:MAG: aminopeptidase [Bacillota bacterium]|nr:aminopeptidase [Bacillota bacterium]
MGEKNCGKELKDKLLFKRKNAWTEFNENEKNIAFEMCEGYKAFLDKAKTEREFTNEAELLAIAHGFKSFDEIVKSKMKITDGMKLYQANRGKSVILCVVGKEPLENGINILGAHIDSPRLDLKQNPVYEDNEIVFLKTHYYGGIKKYQWVTIPLALHGVVIKTDGTVVNVKLGEDDNDMVFTITDLLPHIAVDQMKKNMSEAITGEDLNIIFGSIPFDDEIDERVKLNVLQLLNAKYGITEEDFTSAELEIVPAFKARDVGFDRSMVGAYGQDDRVCAYTSLKAILDVDNTDKTALCILIDKEEIGSVGNTSAQSAFLEGFISNLLILSGEGKDELIKSQCLLNSRMLSADVNAAVDPNYGDVQDKKNAVYIGKGIAIQKYTGSMGKLGANDSNPEFVAEFRKILNENRIPWQAGEFGKVDLGGGSTIAKFAANLGIDVIDCGVPVLSMHSPFEITSKIDIYATYNAYKSFLLY